MKAVDTTKKGQLLTVVSGEIDGDDDDDCENHDDSRVDNEVPLEGQILEGILSALL